MANETPVTAALIMDRAEPLENTFPPSDPEGRRRLSVKIANETSEELPIGPTNIVATTAPPVLPNGTLTKSIVDGYGRVAATYPEAINAEWGQMFRLSLQEQNMSGTGEVTLLLFINPAGSGKAVKLYQAAFGPTLGNQFCTFRVYLNPIVTSNGVVVPINGNRQVSQNATIAQAFSDPVVSTKGVLSRTVIQTGTAGTQSIVQYNFSLWIDQGNSFLITRQLAGNSTAGAIDMTWTEQ